MPDEHNDIDLSKAQTEAEWLSRLDELGEEVGSFVPLGRRHAAFALHGSTDVLLVTFESAAAIRAAGGRQRPLGYEIAQAKGWSALVLVARGDTWFRDQAVFDHFDRLIDDAALESYQRVVFFGAGTCGHAAAAFAVSAPGATVLAVSPQATLDTERAEWDTRFPEARLMDFTSRYGYAPRLSEGAREVFLVYDPARRLDSMHAALFWGTNVTRLRTRWLGRDTAAELSAMGVLPAAIDLACRGQLSRTAFFRLFRRRHSFATYLMRLALRAEAAGRPRLTAAVARAALRLVRSEQLAEVLRRAEAQLSASSEPV